MTKDELFLLKPYEMAQKAGNPLAEVDALTVGRAIGQNDKGAITIVNTLAQTNFIQKKEGTILHLTPHGLKLVQHLLQERRQKWK